MRSLVSYPSRSKDDDVQWNKIAVHVRRQDVKPCGKWAGRYLPNAYFLREIHTHVQNSNLSSRVTIYSTRHNPFEPFDDFAQQENTTLALDQDLVTTWQDMMMANVLIMSISSFSTVPALLNRYGTIVAAPNDLFALTQWHRGNKTGIPPVANCSQQHRRRRRRRR